MRADRWLFAKAFGLKLETINFGGIISDSLAGAIADKTITDIGAHYFLNGSWFRD